MDIHLNSISHNLVLSPSRFTFSFSWFFPLSKIRVVPEAAGPPPSATNRLAGLRAFCLCVNVLVCKATSAVSNETDAMCCFCNLFAFMYCMCFPARIREGTWGDATLRDSVQNVFACVCRKGVGEEAGSVMLLVWQIDVKSSGASLPLHVVNNDERTANEGLCVDECGHTCVCEHGCV